MEQLPQHEVNSRNPQRKKTAAGFGRAGETQTRNDGGVKAVWDSVPDAAAYRLVLSSAGQVHFEYVSAGFESLFELLESSVLRDAAELYGLLHPADRDDAISAQRRSAETGSPFQHECRFKLPSGKTRWIRWHSMPERLPAGGVAWNGVAIDVTARRQAEESFRELNVMLEQRVAERTAEVQQRSRQLALLASELTLVEQRERRRLADYLHDHVQQSLVGARMQAHTLIAATPPHHRAAVDGLCRTLTEAIESARNVSREIAPPIAVFGHLCEALQWLVRDLKQRHNLRVKASFRGELSDVPEAPSILLFTATREMLFNVVKHSGVLEADLELAAEGGAVALRVGDCGCGMAFVDLASPDPLGFGLFSIRERSESMGGSLAVDTSPGRGMRVTVRLPLAAAPAARRKPRKRQKQADTVAQARPQGESAGSGRIRVLFVDDHQIVRESLVRLLHGLTEVEAVGQCGDGQQAVEQAGRLRPDVVVMDMSMPIMDGVEATRRIKERWPSIKVIGLSMFDDADGGGKMRAAGADGYVSKSGPPEDLIKAIRQCARAGGTDEERFSSVHRNRRP